MNSYSDLLAVISTIAAALAAAGSFRAARATKNAAEAAIVRDFLKDYFAPEMSSALRILYDWKKNSGESFATSWIDRLGRGDPDARQVDQARRLVKSYFEQASRLFSNNLISRESFRAIARVAGNITYYDIVDNLELSINQGRDGTTLETMKEHIGRFDGTEKIRHVPAK
jgi:hypothetical protein